VAADEIGIAHYRSDLDDLFCSPLSIMRRTLLCEMDAPMSRDF